MIEVQFAGHRFMQCLVVSTGVKVEPGHDGLVIADGVDTKPSTVVEDDFQSSVFRQGYAQWTTESVQCKAYMIVTYGLDGFRHDAQRFKGVDEVGHSGSVVAVNSLSVAWLAEFISRRALSIGS